MVDYKINVVVDPTGAKKGADAAGKDLDNLGKKALSLQGLLGRLFIGFSAIAAVKSAIGLADAYASIENRLRAVTDAGTDVVAVQEQLKQVADRSRSSFQATAELYSRLITSSKELGKTQGEIIGFTERLNKAINLSGASAAEAEAGILQLSQGLASGALRGDELRSVLEQLPAVADVIARGMGVTRGELRKLGQEGKITAQAIFDAFEKVGPELDQRFDRTNATLGQSFTLLKNEIGSFLDLANDSTGALRGLSAGVQFFADAVAGARKLITSGGLSPNEVRQALDSVAKEGVANLGVAINNVNRELKDLESRKIISDQAKHRIEELRQQLVDLQNTTKQTTKGISPEDAAAAKAAREQEIKLLAIQKELLEDIKGPQQAYANKVSALSTLLEQGKITQIEYNQQLETLGSKLAKVAGTDATKAFADQKKELQDQIDLMRVRLALGDQVAQRVEIEQRLAADGITLTADQKAQLDKLLSTQKELAIVEERRQQAGFRGANTDEQRRMIEAMAAQIDVTAQIADKEALLNAVLEKRPDLIGQVNEQLIDLRLRALESSTALGDGFERAFLKIKKEAEDLAAVGESVVDVFADRATDALVEFAETGKLNFKELASSILSDLARILARLLIIQALNAAFGGGGTAAAVGVGAGVNLAGQRADGGPVSAGRSYLVGEEGPEVFTPKQAGNITPNGESSGRPQTLQIVNVTDPRMVPDAIGAGVADQSIINVISRNKEAIKQTLA